MFATICFWHVQKIVRSALTMITGIRMSHSIMGFWSLEAASMPM